MHLFQRWFHDCKHIWKAYFGKAFRRSVVVLSMSGIVSKRFPFSTVFNFEKSQKLHGAKSAEWGGCGQILRPKTRVSEAKYGTARCRDKGGSHWPIFLVSFPVNRLTNVAVGLCNIQNLQLFLSGECFCLFLWSKNVPIVARLQSTR